MNLLAQSIDHPKTDPFLDLLFNEATGAIFVVVFVILEIFLIHRYFKRKRPADMVDDD